MTQYLQPEGSPARRRKHEPLVSNRAPPLCPLIRANQARNARCVPMHPSRPPSLLLRRLHRVLPDGLAVALHTSVIQIWRSIQDGTVRLAFVRQIRRLGRVARKLVRTDGAPRLEIVLLVLGAAPMCATTQRTQLVGHEEVEKGRGETRAADDVDEVMMRQVHGAPVEHADVRPHVPWGAVPKMGDEERAEGRPAGVEAWEGAKHERGVGEGSLVAVAAKEGVDAGEAARGAGDVVGGGGEAVDDFVPGGSAGYKDLDEDSGEVHVAKSLGPGLEGERGAEEPEEEGEDEWVCVVDEAVGEPSDNI